MNTLTETLEVQHRDLIQYDLMLRSNRCTLEEVGRLSTHIFHYNDEDYNFRFLNDKACQWFCLSREQILSRGDEFIKEFYHPDTIRRELPKIRRLYTEIGDDMIYSTYHQIYNPSINAFCVCLAFIKKCNFLSGFVSILQPIDNYYLLSKKMLRILSEELFKKNHTRDFKYLTSRELEILRLLATGLNNPQIADQLFISRRTVEQHRKNINRKLDVRGFKDIMDYAYAFDLI